MAFEAVKENLEKRGYTVKVFATGAEAAAYLNSEIDGVTVGIGGSGTVKNIGAYELLSEHNTVYWHWITEPNEARKNAMNTDVYLTSVNALAESGEMVNIDGAGNRVASTLFGHKKVYFVIGRNKLVKTYEDAVWRARNIAGPGRAKQMNRKTPCAVKADRCYDCSSPERICRGMVTLWEPMLGQSAEVILIDEDHGL
ncbi:MAG: lactate utilization protein [Oscillibacter sp.]|nr:lactate utilization protein [Oscillibacter sp.]